MSFSALAQSGIDRIYEEDLESQKHFMHTICKTIRKRDEIAPLLEGRCFFVPNASYIRKMFGEESMDAVYNLYNWEGVCLWENYLIFPIWNVVGQVVGFCGFDPITKAKTLDGEKLPTPKYKLSSSTVFNRSKYLYYLPGVYDKCVEEGYAIVSDGMFDTNYFHHEGFNSIGLLGSLLTEELLFQLRFIDTLFVAMDNDEAGWELYKKLKSCHPKVKYIRQNIGKDGDDVLKSEFREQYVKKVWDGVKHSRDVSFRIKPLIRG